MNKKYDDSRGWKLKEAIDRAESKKHDRLVRRSWEIQSNHIGFVSVDTFRDATEQTSTDDLYQRRNWHKQPDRDRWARDGGIRRLLHLIVSGQRTAAK